MAKKIKAEDFKDIRSVRYMPTGHTFTQRGGRIVVFLEGVAVGEFSTEALQIVGTYLTEYALKRAAMVWLEEYL